MIFVNNDDFNKIAVIAIKKKGYNLRIEKTVMLPDAENLMVIYIAENERFFLKAENLIDLLGLIELGEVRGEEWRLNEKENATKTLAKININDPY